MKAKAFHRILEQPNEELWDYNATDCEVTWVVGTKLMSDAFHLNAQRTHNLMLKMAPAAYAMQEYGLMVSVERRQELLRGVKARLEERAFAVTKVFADLFGDELRAAVELGAVMRRLMNPRRKPYMKAKPFNPRSKAHLIMMLKRLGLKWDQRTATGLSRLDLDIIMKLRRENPKQEALLTCLWEYAKLEKVRADWLEDTAEKHLLCHDSRLRASVRVCGTQSGRLSESSREWCSYCVEPNHGRNRQNLPKSDDPFCAEHAPIASMIIAPPGRALVERDYSAQEAWIAAILSKDQLFIDKLKDPYGIHIRNAQDLFAIPRPEDVTPIQKRLAKIFLYGGVLYEGGPETIKGSFEEHGLIVPLSDVKLWQARWKVAHHQYVRWCHDLVAKAQRSRPMAAITALGRRRNFVGPVKDWRRDAIAHVISGTGADHTNMAMVDLHDQGWHIVLHKHDSLILEVNQGDINGAVQATKYAFEMDRGIGPLKSEAKVGHNLAKMEDV